MDRIEQIAKTCHEVNRAYCKANGDESQVPWESAPNWQRNSCIDGVEFHLANPNGAPGDSHRNWLAEKERTGWKYGPKKDPEKKEHHCIVPFEALPLMEQIKDHLFVAVVRSLAE